MSRVFAAHRRAAVGVVLLGAAALSVAAGGASLIAFAAALAGLGLLTPELVGIDDSAGALRRFGYSALTCFTLAIALYVCARTIRATGPEMSQQVALAGFAFWAVALLLASATAWHWARLGQVTRGE